MPPLAGVAPCLALGQPGLEGQRMQRAAHVPFQRVVDKLVLLNTRLATERLGNPDFRTVTSGRGFNPCHGA